MKKIYKYSDGSEYHTSEWEGATEEDFPSQEIFSRLERVVEAFSRLLKFEKELAAKQASRLPKI